MKFVCPLITVKDIDLSRHFYENVLKQKVKHDFGENVTFFGDFAIHLESHYKKLLGGNDHQIIKKSNNFELYFECENIDEIFNELKNRNIEFIHEIKKQPWQQRVMRFYDPDFHIIEIGESMENVILQLNKNGLSVEDIINKTSMPIEFVKNVLNK